MAARRVVVAMASPRKDGNSTILAHKVADGATAAGAEVELFKLHEMDIKPCDGCDACQQKRAKAVLSKTTCNSCIPNYVRRIPGSLPAPFTGSRFLRKRKSSWTDANPCG